MKGMLFNSASEALVAIDSILLDSNFQSQLVNQAKEIISEKHSLDLEISRYSEILI